MTETNTDDETDIDPNYARNPDHARQIAELQRQIGDAEDRAVQADSIAKRAIHLVKKDQQIEALEAEVDELRDRIATLEGRVTPDPATKEYDEKTRDERVREVRLTLARTASNSGGKAAMDYNDVLMLFNGHPSPGYAYKLLELAANLDGFTYEKREGANDRLCVNLDAVSDDSVFHAVNKDETGEGR